ncbi:hypothetical protein AC249_AIPGENE16560, partial [Exaiptasia diaphana]
YIITSYFTSDLLESQGNRSLQQLRTVKMNSAKSAYIGFIFKINRINAG